MNFNKNLFFLIVIVFLIFVIVFSIISNNNAKKYTKDIDNTEENLNNNESEKNMESNKIKISINGNSFTATLYDNVTANEFVKLLPLNITMNELNSNEKFFNLPSTLTVNLDSYSSINSGDLMLYNNNCLVLFYEDFNTSYKYTKIGKIDDVTNLKSVLGRGNIQIAFENVQ